MKGDFSRPTFDPKKGYSGVLLQQGRVLLDADWNEQGAIVRNRVETETRDVIGGCGGPKVGAGFELAMTDIITTAPEFPRPDVDIEEFVATGPTQAKGLNFDPFPKELTVSAGRYYVDGILIENNRQRVPVANQPDFPAYPGRDLFDRAGRYVAYLDVWDRHITALDDPTIREIALGGPDTTTRSKTIWQVKFWYAGTDETQGCDAIPAFNTFLAAPTGKMTARTAPAAADQGPCIVSPGAGYLGLENQLYRVEVHEPNPTDGVVGGSFKWSRDNGTTVTTIEKIEGAKITVHDVGPDSVLGFAQGQWAELTDDVLELNGLPGQLIEIASVDVGRRIITLKSAPLSLDMSNPDGVNPARHPKLRRWDGFRTIAADITQFPDGFIDLEDGVQVQFSTGTYRTGDYWTIPARTATADAASGNIEWPRLSNGAPSNQFPFGVRHHYCRIGMVTADSQGTITDVDDCRCLFPALNDLEGFFYVGGDGQEVMPGGVMPQPLQVGVFKVGMSNNCVPVRGARVRFYSYLGGRLSDTMTGAAASGPGQVFDIDTDSNGVAAVYWRPDPNEQYTSQTVVARQLYGAAGVEGRQTVVFNGQLSIASEVAYKPGTCSTLKDADTVQEALDILCSKLGDCHDFLDELRSDGVVRDGEGVLGFEVIRENPVLLSFSVSAGIAYVGGCRRVVPASGPFVLDPDMTEQMAIVDNTGTVRLVQKDMLDATEPPAPAHAKLAALSAFDGKLQRIVDLRRDLTELDDRVDNNEAGVAASHQDARAYVPLLSQTLPHLRLRDGRDRFFTVANPGCRVFDGRSMWIANPVGTSVTRIDRFAADANGGTEIEINVHTYQGVFDGRCVWFTGMYMVDRRAFIMDPNLEPGGAGGVINAAKKVATVVRSNSGNAKGGTDKKNTGASGSPGKRASRKRVVDSDTPVERGHTSGVVDVGAKVPGVAAAEAEANFGLVNFLTPQYCLVAIDTVTLEHRVVDLDEIPVGITFDGSFVWVGHPGEQSLSQVDVERNKVTGTVDLTPHQLVPYALAFDGEWVWAMGESGSTMVVRVDPQMVEEPKSTVYPEHLHELNISRLTQAAFDGARMWLLDEGGRVLVVDAFTMTTVSSLATAAKFVRGLVFDGTYMWHMVGTHAIDLYEPLVFVPAGAPNQKSGGNKKTASASNVDARAMRKTKALKADRSGGMATRMQPAGTEVMEAAASKALPELFIRPFIVVPPLLIKVDPRTLAKSGTIELRAAPLQAPAALDLELYQPAFDGTHLWYGAIGEAAAVPGVQKLLVV